MTLRISALLLPALADGSVLRAQPVFQDSQAPPDRGLGDLNSRSSSLRFAIAGDAAESKALAQTLHVASLRRATPPAYAIRRAELGGRAEAMVGDTNFRK
jgi:hypothetical protein